MKTRRDRAGRPKNFPSCIFVQDSRKTGPIRALRPGIGPISVFLYIFQKYNLCRITKTKSNGYLTNRRKSGKKAAKAPKGAEGKHFSRFDPTVKRLVKGGPAMYSNDAMMQYLEWHLPDDGFRRKRCGFREPRGERVKEAS